jgi:hypothetical protein
VAGAARSRLVVAPARVDTVYSSIVYDEMKIQIEKLGAPVNTQKEG